MKKAKKLVVGNWKMYPERLEDAKKIVADVRRVMTKVRKTNVVLCPPFVYTPIFSGIKKGNLHLGTQDTNAKAAGSLTGEVSVSQIEQFNVDYVIVGHSERRKMGETDAVINEKVRAVIDYGMTAILCVGEQSRDHNGDYLGVIKNQISNCLNGIEKKFLGQVVVAYEPVWTIGAKEAMSSRDVHEMSIYIKKVLRDIFGDPSSMVLVLYGGAVDKFNTESIVRDGDVSGLLIGRQSLESKDFVEIIKIVDKI
ncbi:MAG: triose-phosphate isomerase [Minisyncoccia bacterium]